MGEIIPPKVKHIPVRYNSSGSNTETISVSLPKDLVKEIRDRATANSESISRTVTKMIKEK